MKLLIDKIAQELDNTVFVWNENYNACVDGPTIKYNCSRGEMYMCLCSPSANDKVTLLDTETTIENIVNYVEEKYRKQLLEVGTHTLFVSEGLSKGAVVHVG